MSLALADPPVRSTQPAPSHVAPQVAVCTKSMDFQQLSPAEVDSWRLFVCENAASTFQLHPESLPLDRRVKTLTAWISTNSTRELAGLAALIEEHFDLSHHLLPVGRRRLSGFRLAGDRILHQDDPGVLTALVDALADAVLSSRAEMVEIEDVDVSSPLWAALHRLAERGFKRPTPIPPQPHHCIRMPADAEAYWGRFSSKDRSELRRRRKKLGEARIERYTEAAQIDAFISHARTVSLQSWQHRQRGISVSGDLQERRMLEFLASEGAWRSYVLLREERPIAFALGYQRGGTYHYDRVGYDSEFAQLAPGKMLLVEILNDLFAERTPHTFDFGPGHLDYKGFFSNETTSTATIWLMPPGLRSEWVLRSWQLRRAAGSALRRALEQTGLKEWAHRIHRRGWRALWEGRQPKQESVPTTSQGERASTSITS
ncbi:MAG: GNAT family N-acetyltransferase [Planctomycetaceae bacterium]|nr:GNAT family N-acetyltransferase [Planctomycetaceae bacterium]